MKTKQWVFLIMILLGLFMASSACAQGEQQLTMTLLPAKEKSASPGDAKFLWIQTNPARDIFLQFDLSRLPPGLEKSDFVRCTLRIVAKDVQYDPKKNSQLVSVTGQIANNDLTPVKNAPEIVSLSTLCATETKKNNVALNLKADTALRDEVYRKYSETEDKDKKISLLLHTTSEKASSLFYSSTDTVSPCDPSNLPRLVIEYKPKPQDLLESVNWLQHQQNPEHTGRQPWIPFRNPTKFCLKTILPLPQINESKGSIVDYPLIYRGDLYIIGKFDKENYLFSFDFTGKERWRHKIDAGTVQRSPVISTDGIIYIVTEDQIAAYDLHQSGKYLCKYKPDNNRKLAAFTDLTIGNDNSLFLALAESDLNYIYGFTPSLKPFLKAGPFGTSQDKISTITVSPDGRKIFAQVPAVGDSFPAGAVVVDVANPSEQQRIEIHDNPLDPKITRRKPWEYYHVPIVGPSDNVMIFSDFPKKESKSNIWGYSPSPKLIWNSASDKTLVGQPVLGSNGYVYYIQNGQLQRHKYKNMGKGEIITKGNTLNATSNLVMDGADNIYFWDNGSLHSYKPDGTSMFRNKDGSDSTGIVNECKNNKKGETIDGKIVERNKDDKGEAIDGPEQFIRLMMGPDGTLWTNNKKGGELFAFKPVYEQDNLTLKKGDIKSRTAYRATGKLSVGDGTDEIIVEGGMQLLFQAQEGVGFAKGFRVKKDASIVVRTGF
jgi:hypothetical protein